MVSYNILDAWHSGDGVILLVGLQSYNAHLSVTFISDMQCMTNSVVMFVSYSVTPAVCDIIATPFLILILRPFYWCYVSHLFLKDCGIRRTLK